MMLNIQSRPCCGKQDVVLHPSRAVVLSRPTVRGCSLLQQNQQVQRPSWVVGAGQNGFPWDVLGGAKKMRGHPWNGEELSHAQVLQRQAEGSKAQAAEAGTEVGEGMRMHRDVKGMRCHGISSSSEPRFQRLHTLLI
eukprot:1157470-Pelagomonas_calceolata.AAC.2